MQPETVNSAPATNPNPAPAGPAASGSTWPGGFGAYKPSKAAVKLNLAPYLILIVISIAISILPDVFKDSPALSALLQLVIFIASMALSVATIVVLLGGARRQKVSLNESFKPITPMLVLKMVGLSIVTSVLMFLSLLAFIIPFFFVFPRLMLAPLYLVDRKLGVFDSISASWKDTKGNVGKVYGIVGVTLLFALLMITIIGIPFSIYFLIMYSAAYVLLYQYVNGETLASVDAEVKDTPYPASPTPATPAEPTVGALQPSVDQPQAQAQADVTPPQNPTAPKIQ